MPLFDDEYYMRIALAEAEEAYAEGEVPVGAVVVANDVIIAKGHNQTESLKDVTAHAEIIAITAAENHLAAKYLQECTLYVTLEPCLMCAGAIAHAQLKRLVFAARDPKKGYLKYLNNNFLSKTEIVENVLAIESTTLLKQFFSERR